MSKQPYISPWLRGKLDASMIDMFPGCLPRQYEYVPVTHVVDRLHQAAGRIPAATITLSHGTTYHAYFRQKGGRKHA